MKKFITPHKIFFVICIAGIIIYFIYLILYGRHALTWLLLDNNIQLWGFHFFVYMEFAKKTGDIYTRITDSSWGCYPPLFYYFYHFLYNITRDISGQANPTLMLYIRFYIYVLYSILVSITLLCSIKHLDKSANDTKLILLFFCIFFSAPIMPSSLFIGNPSMLVLSLLFFFLMLKDSESRVYREISLIILSCCIATKIYPLIFLLLFIKEKRYKEFIRLIIYNFILFFGTFILFGGIDGFIHWMYHVKTLFCSIQSERIQYIHGLIYMIIMNFFTRDQNMLANIISTSVSIIFLVLLILLAWKSKNYNRTIFFLVCVMVFCPVNAYRFRLCYLAIPLALWLLESKSLVSKEDWIYGICNGLIFSVPIWVGIITDFQPRYVDFWLYSVSYLLVLVEIFYEILSRFHRSPVEKASIP